MNTEKQYRELPFRVNHPEKSLNKLNFVDCRPQTLIQAGLIRDIQLLQNDHCFNENVVQCSKLGKFCTALGAGSLGALGALLGGAPGAAIATGGYLLLKKIIGGPFIGGKHNIDILQAGGDGTVGIGHINKKHCPSHSVGYVDGFGYDQTIDPQTNLAGVDLFEGFDPVRGRVAQVHVPIENSAAVLTGLNRQRSVSPVPYHIWNNNCVTNVNSIHRLSGLKEPIWAKIPTLNHLWAKILSGLQKIM